MRYGLGFSAPTPNVTRFLIVIIALFLVFALLGRTPFGIVAYNSLLLDPHAAIFSFELWRLLTYGFLHDISSPLHVIFNALLLYMVGPQLEDRWGEMRFFIFMLTSIFLGGVLVCIAFLLGLTSSVVVGFSAATIGLIIAWGLTFSSQHIYVFGIFPLTGKQLVYVTVGLEVLYAVSSNSISSAAHFGGILAGFIFTLGLYKPSRLKGLWRQKQNKRNWRG